MSGLFGYSHLTGGYPGGQAEYVRVPFSDVGPIVIPDGLDDEQVLFLSDILPDRLDGGRERRHRARATPSRSGAAARSGSSRCRARSCMGASAVIAIDHYPHRLELARGLGAEVDRLRADRGARGADGDDRRHRPRRGDRRGRHGGHGFAIDNLLDTVKQKIGVGADRGHALREAIMACRKGGRVSMPGVYGGFLDKFPLGALMEKGLQLKTGQTHVQRYTPDLLRRIEEGEIDTTFLISHRLPLEEAPIGYRNFQDKQNEWTKVVLKPEH